MAYAVFADAVVALHLGFIVFVAAGGVASWRWPRLLWAHVPAVVWSAGLVSVGYGCPLTWLERRLRSAAGEHAPAEGFVDRYLEGVVYPESATGLLRALVAAAVVAGWAGLAIRRRRRAALLA